MALSNRFASWVDRLPFPMWMFYPVLFLLIGLLLTVSVWIEGSLPVGDFNVFVFILGTWTVESLFLTHILINASRPALNEFRPLLKIADNEFDKLLLEFTQLPLRGGLISIVLGLVVGIFGPIQLYQLTSQESFPISLPLLIFIGMFGTVLFMLFLYRVYYQLKFVRNLYSALPSIDFNQLEPIYALSKFTAKIGFLILFFLYVNPMFLIAPGSITSLFFAPLFIAMSLLPLGAFILPLLEINQRLSDEKDRLVSEMNTKLEKAKLELFHLIDKKAYGEMSQFQNGINALSFYRDEVAKTPTWPWKPETIRWFVTALILPLGIWFIQFGLQRILAL